ncbi:Type I phosphodiesterase / nucleotide pyrophosphatase [Hyunsoonleella jejuensis]|uniref:Type I phosphodiesterase / nucleotide pyrophosphatase n=1 Tax=Hyunsoonleella jejuensis TaxID=419940 RepID=A0A1H9IX64_9FLAO|nr:alkaline phosphatase family protein [Hyunsoonleella jejuensis]SEQ79391.1 Type I phosphodiesterase / nucleotide pyrophosphatase [Hyunsoonleella jejuensis]
MRSLLGLILICFLVLGCKQSKQTKQISNVQSEALEKNQPIVVQFIIDGLMKDAAETAIQAGAINLKYFAENGVIVEDAYSNSPMGRVKLPDGTEPWGGASPPNIGMHTGTHVFETQDLDDIFLSARRKGIKSVYVGGHTLYDVFKTPDIYYAEIMPDQKVVELGIKHIKEDGVRLVRLHLQEIRSFWKGPQDKTNTDSAYIKAILNADVELGKLVAFLKNENLWERAFFIISADHGMGTLTKSNHLPEQLSSWQIYMNFYGPNVKKGATIPYAESPDVALMTNHFMGLPKLKGYTSKVNGLKQLGTTGIFLKNIFEGKSKSLNHPQWIKRYLDENAGAPANDYLHYREAMLKFINN